MALEIEVVTDIPDSSYRRGPRNSSCYKLYQAALTAPTHKLVVKSEELEEIERTYKAMLQWAARHKALSVMVRKDGDLLYIWLPDETAADRADTSR